MHMRWPADDLFITLLFTFIIDKTTEHTYRTILTPRTWDWNRITLVFFKVSEVTNYNYIIYIYFVFHSLMRERTCTNLFIENMFTFSDSYMIIININIMTVFSTKNTYILLNIWILIIIFYFDTEILKLALLIKTIERQKKETYLIYILFFFFLYLKKYFVILNINMTCLKMIDFNFEKI